VLGPFEENIWGIAEYARSPSARQFCREALAIVARLLGLWYRFRGDLHDRHRNPQPIDRRQLILKSIPLQKKPFALAETHLDHADREVLNLAMALFIHFERLFTFLQPEGVEPTNTWRRASCALPSATAAATVKIATACVLLSRRLAGGSIVTYWATSLLKYVATAVKPPHLLCSRNGADHVNCYHKCNALPVADPERANSVAAKGRYRRSGPFHRAQVRFVKFLATAAFAGIRPV
jgi:hypothetical protein